MMQSMNEKNEDKERRQLSTRVRKTILRLSKRDDEDVDRFDLFEFDFSKSNATTYVCAICLK